jgi:hypothetical protein
MTTAYSSRGRGISYGYGLQLSTLGGHPLVYHGGGHKGVAAYAGFAAAEGVVCTVLTNFAEAPVTAIWAACMRTALGLPPGPLFEPVEPISLSVEILRNFAGTYLSLEAGRLRVVVDGAEGASVEANGASFRARPAADDTLVFDSPGGEQTIQFLRLGGSEVSHAFQGGRVIKRVGASAD